MAAPTVTPVGANALTTTSANLIGSVNPNIPGAGTTAWFGYRPLAGQAYSTTVTQDVPVAYWRLDETTGTVATDMMTGRPATYAGAFLLNQPGLISNDTDAGVVVVSEIAGGIPVTGTISAAPDAALFPSIFSYEAWIKPQLIDAGRREVVNTPAAIVYVATVAGQPSVTAFLTNNGAQLGAVPITAGQTAHVVLTYDGGTATLYVNGVARTSVQTVYTAFGLQSLVWGDGNGWNGTLDEIAVYNYALTPAQVAAHYDVGTVGYYETPAVAVPGGVVPVTITAELTGLVNGETYQFVLVAQNSSGTVTSYPLTFTTVLPSGTTSTPSEPFGTPAVSIPHFAFPFSLALDPAEASEIVSGREVTSETEGGAVVVEQGSLEEVAANVRVVLACPIGACPQLPTFGATPRTFDLAPLDTRGLLSEIQQWESRATLAIAAALLPDEASQRLTINVSASGDALT